MQPKKEKKEWREKRIRWFNVQHGSSVHAVFLVSTEKKKTILVIT
jgi:hypothetical protein